MFQRDLRSVADSAEHRFAIKHMSERHAVQTADEFVRAPDFDTMCVTEAMQSGIRITHIARDPCALRPQMPFAASEHDGVERRVDAYIEPRVAQSFRQTARDLH